jgi:hypothetical protein
MGLNETEFGRLLHRALSGLRGRKLSWDEPLWVARACSGREVAGASGGASMEYEVLVFFSQRTRVAESSGRLGLGQRTWCVRIEALPCHGKGRKEFFRDELERWSRGGSAANGLFGTGFAKLGVGHERYGGTVTGEFRVFSFGDARTEDGEYVRGATREGQQQQMDRLVFELQQLRDLSSEVKVALRMRRAGSGV